VHFRLIHHQHPFEQVNHSTSGIFWNLNNVEINIIPSQRGGKIEISHSRATVDVDLETVGKSLVFTKCFSPMMSTICEECGQPFLSSFLHRGTIQSEESFPKQ
jgi:hypothetical protein